ncbi:helix-turn-helix domain-containing protein [Bacillus toyonensis]|uniref:helix-turn-helix domain-containing protein n=1 Tax=Bacillus toyonensis TaxID=155322 RepID=UPI00159BEAE7|nr:helix-turn-helix transcriptional regulator [Bacillus toyonensis]MED2693905.1 helix-turn-helix transcriptional regulator [Bacillus toyonensis]
MTLIEYLRKEKGLSQAQLSRELLNISPSAIAQIENEYRKSWPKLREQLSHFFDVEEGVLFNVDGWPKKINIDLPKIPLKSKH